MVWFLKKTGNGSPNVRPVPSDVLNRNLMRMAFSTVSALLFQAAVYAVLLS